MAAGARVIAEDYLLLARDVARTMSRKFRNVEYDDLYAELSLWLVEKGDAVEAKDPGSTPLMVNALSRAALNYCLSARAQMSQFLDEDALVDYNNPEDIVVGSERDRAVRAAALGHSPESAAIFGKHFVERQTHAVVAWTLGMPESTYYRVYGRILDDLRVELGEWA